MYESLSEHSSNFTLYIFPFDSTSESVLRALNLEHVVIITLTDFETPELLEVKKERSKAEYCWTCTPSVISYVLRNFGVDNCTYVDADLFFYSNPAILISELSKTGKSVLITEHRYSLIPKIYEEKRSGRFCVQFMTFLSEAKSLEILDTWRLQCIEWCFARHEDGKFGDQKYLDVWPLIYENVHILVNEGGGVAPWNIQKYRFIKSCKTITGIFRSNGIQFDTVFYHFQYVKFLKNGTFDIGWYIISSHVKKIFYSPYIMHLLEIERIILKNGDGYTAGFTDYQANSLWSRIKIFLKKDLGYNIINLGR
jgi:hypothetical protein